MFKGSEIQIDGAILKANIILMGMYNIDMILGLDLLSTYHASMNCFTKKIAFWKLGYSKIEFKCDRKILTTCVISALEAKRLLHKGCEAYLTHVINKSSFEVTLDNVPIVCEFPNVFLKDLPGLPTDKELEFGIELLLGSAPVSIPPYKMAQAELKELKTQFQDLIDKGFIQPNVSPWGAPVLFVKKKDGTMRFCIDYR